MAYYIEEEAWKCPKHPSKKRRTTTGVCSICLRDRLSKLCPHCANVRPCSCNCAAASTTSSSSSGKIGGEAAFCRSKSVGIPFLKSRNINSSSRRNQLESEKSNKTASFWWIFKSRKRAKENELESKANSGNDKYCNDTRIKEFSMMVMRSRSVNVAMTSVSGGNNVNYSPEKLKGWYLVSPMNVFRQSTRAPKLVN